MSSATGYQLVAPPQVAPGEVTRVVAVLVGGTDLDATLTVNLTGGLVSSSGGSVPIVIDPGQLAGSATFTVLGETDPWPGQGSIAASHSGGNAGMADPPPSLVHVIGPGYVPPAALRLTHLDLPAGTQPTWTPNEFNPPGTPSGKGHVIAVERLGDYLPHGGLLTLMPSDDAGGQFYPGRLTFDYVRDPAYRPLGLLYYFPAVDGLRTVTLACSGIPGPLAGSSISFQANL
jgi:hypothetical protein